MFDNRLGLAILRLDRRAETGMTVNSRGERFSFPGEGRGPGQRGTAASERLDPGLRRGTVAIDWTFAIEALRTGDDEGVARALALVEEPALSRSKGDKVEEVEGPSVSLSQANTEDAGLDLSGRCWKDHIDDIWMTDFPPPEGFGGYESGPHYEYDDPEPYVRACTEEEVAILEADRAALWAGERAEEEELRDQWFALLKESSSNADDA